MRAVVHLIVSSIVDERAHLATIAASTVWRTVVAAIVGLTAIADCMIVDRITGIFATGRVAESVVAGVIVETARVRHALGSIVRADQFLDGHMIGSDASRNLTIA